MDISNEVTKVLDGLTLRSLVRVIVGTYHRIVLVVCFTIFFTSIQGEIAPEASPQAVYWKNYRIARSQYKWLTKSIYNRIVYESQRMNGLPKVDYKWVLALIQAETGDYCRNKLWCMVKAVSPAGALGLMQVMPSWNKNNPKVLLEVGFNIRRGVMIFRKYYRRAGNNVRIAIRYYNTGPNGSGMDPEYLAKIVRRYRKSVYLLSSTH